MTKILNFSLKIKGGGVVGRVTHATPPTLPPPYEKKFETCTCCLTWPSQLK